jgi:hypothetical protein
MIFEIRLSLRCKRRHRENVRTCHSKSIVVIYKATYSDNARALNQDVKIKYISENTSQSYASSTNDYLLAH